MSQSAPSAAGVADAARQKKRARISGAAEGHPNARHSQKYWFEDGNIILRVEETLFRVHRGILSRHSTVFKDMFALPQPDRSGGEDIEGCDVVDLPGDKARDWEKLFAVLYDFATDYKKQGEFPADILASMLRLGRKYQFDGIFKESLERIREVIPTTLDEFSGLPKVFSGTNYHRTYVLLEILLEIGNQTLLPAVYFYCSAYLDVSGIFHYCRRSAVGDISVLSETIVTGRQKLSTACAEVMLRWALPTPSAQPWLEPAHKICRMPHLCLASKRALVNLLVPCPHPPVALMSGSEVVKMLPTDKICPSCALEISTVHDTHREAMWEKLPSFFDLPAWKDLKDL